MPNNVRREAAQWQNPVGVKLQLKPNGLTDPDTNVFLTNGVRGGLG